MGKIVRLAALAGLATCAFAETWTGKLVDAACIEQQSPDSCDPTPATVALALYANGRIFVLDSASNIKALEALRIRQKRTPAVRTRIVTTKVTGCLEDDVVKAETVLAQ
jgi:hypothetical protein